MNSFTFHNPTKLIFGAGQLQQLKEEVPKYGKRVLLLYGGGSIKRNGIYDNVIRLLDEIGAAVVELGGVEPNPRLSTVQRGVDLCRGEGIELILAVGGGSVIDCAKAIAAGSRYEGDVWDFYTRKATAKDALPIGTVLTIAATGSEMNGSTVVTNWETKEKLGWGSPYVYPKFSILDPHHTMSLPRDQTVYGMADIMSHVFEHYFHRETNTPLQDGFCEALLRTVIEAAPKLVNDLQSYEQRETILYCGTMALNGILNMGYRGDWATHDIEHAVSAVYDIPHGGGLAILFPNWMTYVLEENVGRFKQFAVNVFGVRAEGRSDREVAEEGIAALRRFWTSIGAPGRLADYGIDDSQLEAMADKATKFGPIGNFKKLNRQDVLNIYRSAL
ncbi:MULTISPECIES: iron-containing alcohol dehydrogenase [unclassified Paenibacillus]|uniref:iron-containing alcohol dehydrogenase n=1 Tax=unclassified Paenibacillus TaxID=185978 RepID=UPI001C1070AC|nr:MULTISPECIES: iron-containing alcohol dehydrogenase [unclassified Paenibacillus]MBU5442582.1 iron-containing alcohol dehydrogenase [Paenibacillus sp. MSJ-34]CAH0119036.1 Long-chain-alcohol dehydrogenase 2 [Paenibacillus sp. CECT 9249]